MTVCVAVVDDVDGLLACGAYALGVRGDLRESRRCFDEAFGLAEQVGDAAGLAAAAIGSGGLWVHERRTAADVALLHARLRQAVAGVDPGSGLGLRLRARLIGEADYRTGTHSEILAVLDEARRLGDPVAVAEAVNIAHHCLLGPGHGPQRRALAAELTELSVRTGRRIDYLLGLLWQTVDLFLDGDPHAQRRLNELKPNWPRKTIWPSGSSSTPSTSCCTFAPPGSTKPRPCARPAPHAAPPPATSTPKGGMSDN